MPDHFFQRCSLRVKILGIIFFVLALSLLLGLFFIWNVQRDKLVGIYRQSAKQMGITMESGLRDAMLRKDRDAIQKNINQISRVMSLVHQISILNNQGQIILSTEPARRGTVLRKKSDESCTFCHEGSGAAVSDISSIELKSAAGSFLRTIVKIKNTPECYTCHPAPQKINGVLLIDSSLKEINGIHHAITARIIIAGLGTFFVLICLISWVITRFVSTPLRAIMQGIRDIEHGDLDSWVEVETSGEFFDMVTSFNIMKKAIKRYLGEVKLKNTEITTLYTIVRRMSETMELGKIKEIVISFLAEVFQAECVLLILPIDKEEHVFELCGQDSTRHYSGQYALDLDGPEPPHACLSREELRLWLHKKLVAPHYGDDDNRALIPLQVKEMKLGLLVVNKAPPQRFSQSEKKIIPALMYHIAISLANARLYSLAITDDLTALHTKRYFQTKIKDLDSFYRHAGEGYCIMMLDLDHFKRVNDQYGHPVGDALLKDVAELIKKNLRQGDIPNRYGGEEFVILLPNCEVDGAKAIAERLRLAVERHAFQYEGLPPIKQTVSIGISCCPLHAAAKEELLSKADSALYQAKGAGRNRVVVY